MPSLGQQDVVARARPTQAVERPPRVRPMFVVASAAALASAIGVLAAWGWIASTPGLRVREVRVTGGVHVDAAALGAGCGALGANVLTVDLEDVRRRVLEDRWIASARVRRSLPHAIVVEVIERVPVGRVELPGRALMVDGEGVTVGPHVAGDLPLIAGPERVMGPARRESIRLGAATLAALRAAAPAYADDVVRVEVRADGGLDVTASGHPPLIVSGPSSADEVAAYAARRHGMARAMGPIAQVDARWRDRLFVLPRAGESRISAPASAPGAPAATSGR